MENKGQLFKHTCTSHTHTKFLRNLTFSSEEIPKLQGVHNLSIFLWNDDGLGHRNESQELEFSLPHPSSPQKSPLEDMR